MKFKYDDQEFVGTRDEVIGNLRAYLGDRTICYAGAQDKWYFCKETIGGDCWTPMDIKRMLIGRIVNTVPRDEIEFEGKIFDSIEDLKAHLESLPLGSDGGTFTLGGRRLPVNCRIYDVNNIKEQMIKEILDEV